jgi:hypothetical protein
MATRVTIIDPLTFRRRQIARDTLACTARLTARQATNEPSELYRTKAKTWYNIARRAGISEQECRDSVSGASGMDFGGTY